MAHTETINLRIASHSFDQFAAYCKAVGDAIAAVSAAWESLSPETRALILSGETGLDEEGER